MGLANDIYTRNRGKRLFPLIILGASLGAVIGAAFTTLALANAGAFELMLVAAAGIAVTIGLTIWVNTRERSAGRDAAGENADKPLGKAGG